MKKHAEIGYDMLKYSKRPLLKCASIIAYKHHEKHNSESCPNGTSDEDILMHGRITATVDVFDA